MKITIGTHMLRKCGVNVQRFAIVLRKQNLLYKKKRTRTCFPLPPLSPFALLCSLWPLGLLWPSHVPVPSRVAEHCLSSSLSSLALPPVACPCLSLARAVVFLGCGSSPPLSSSFNQRTGNRRLRVARVEPLMHGNY